MSQITGLIDGTNINHDYQISSIGNTLLNQGVISGLLVSTNAVAAGSGYIKCVRTNGQEIFVHYLNTATVTITTSGTKKVWIGVDQAVIDNGSGNALDGTGIATIQTGASYPASNYIPLASITGGVITDERVFVTVKASVPRSGFTPGSSNMLPVIGRASLPIVNGDFSTGSGTQTGNGWVGDASYGWYLNGSGTRSATFDTGRMKLSTLASASYCELASSSGGYYVPTDYWLPIEPNTTYTLEFDMQTNYVSGDSTSGAFGGVYLVDALGGSNVSYMTTPVKTTTGNTHYTKTFTTGATHKLVKITGLVYGHTGAGTLVMDAWYDNFSLTCQSKEIFKSIERQSSLELIDTVLIQTKEGGIGDIKYVDMVAGINANGKYVQTAQIGETVGSGVNAMAVVSNIKYLPSGLTVNAGSFVRQGIRFTVPYDCTLGVVKSWVNASSGSAVIELRDDTGTLITSQTVTSGTNSAIFSQALTAGVTYRLVLNDTVNFTSNGYRVAIATFQAGFPYAVGGTTNGTNDATYCWSFSEINLNFGGKAFKARADRLIEKEFSYLAGFVTGPKVINDVVTLDNNPGTFVTGFTGLTAETEYYVTNTAGTIATTPGTVFSKVGMAKGTTGILIKKEWVAFDETFTNTVTNSTNYTNTFTGARDYFIILASFALDSGSLGGGGIQIESTTQTNNTTHKLKYMARSGQVSRGYATNSAGNNNAQVRMQAFYYD